jgi:hypothetical protein
VTLVLDASSSIGDSEQLQVKQAANAFLDGLDNTNSTARVVQFSGTSAQIIARHPISGQGLIDLKDAIDTKYHDRSATPTREPTGSRRSGGRTSPPRMASRRS